MSTHERTKIKMKIHSIYDKEFAPFGRVISGFDTAELVDILCNKTPLPKAVQYVAEEPELQNSKTANALKTSLFGGMPMQFGWCNGHNTKLNCLEYHRDSEFNLGTEEFILLLGRQQEIDNFTLDTSKVKAFKVPAGVLIEVYATSLHYAPCHADAQKGFKVMVALTQGTNGPKPEICVQSKEDELLTACNKWLLAHAESSAAKDGAKVCLTGENIDIANII